jgi:hypothetical protein
MRRSMRLQHFPRLDPVQAALSRSSPRKATRKREANLG